MERNAHKLWTAVLVIMGLAGWGGSAAAADGNTILNARCSACHERLPDGGLARVSAVRKTPEGWDMTLVRMMMWHGVRLTPGERASLVKYLSDRQGLAPQEAAPHRALLEKRPAYVEPAGDQTLTEICARCHTYGRFALQRRDEADWRKLAHMHLGQFPTAEYQAMARDRKWWEIASEEVPAVLAERFPLQTAAWEAWKLKPWRDLSGTWRVVGKRPGRGAYSGTATITLEGQGHYAVRYELQYADGTALSGSGKSIVYTGYEWRGSVTLGSEEVREVYEVSADGNRIRGRWFLTDADEIGGDLEAVRVDSEAIVAVQPPFLKAGETAEITVHGAGLNGSVDLGDGVETLATLSATPEKITVRAQVSSDAAVGSRTIKIGSTPAEGMFTVYRQVDSVQVEPPMSIARVGGNGGPIPPVKAQFEAVGYANGPDGKPGTEDDVRIGVMPASWETANNGEFAAAMNDVKFAGDIDSSGLFTPAAAGPNPARPMSANNVGDLLVKATVDDDGRRVEGSGHLIVTVQRWNDPPIR